MIVDPHTAQHKAEHAGRPYYFCSAGCRAKFLAEPESYLDPAAAEVVPILEGTVYTCPMHPEIRQDGPGSCPICGMALEPEMPSLEDDDNPELRDFSRRFWWTLPLDCGDARAGHVRPVPPACRAGRRCRSYRCRSTCRPGSSWS
jgi:Cu+-exporting ATPase